MSSFVSMAQYEYERNTLHQRARVAFVGDDKPTVPLAARSRRRSASVAQVTRTTPPTEAEMRRLVSAGLITFIWKSLRLFADRTSVVSGLDDEALIGMVSLPRPSDAFLLGNLR